MFAPQHKVAFVLQKVFPCVFFSGVGVGSPALNIVVFIVYVVEKLALRTAGSWVNWLCVLSTG